MPALAQISHHPARWALAAILTLLLFSPGLVVCVQTSPAGPDPIMVAAKQSPQRRPVARRRDHPEEHNSLRAKQTEQRADARIAAIHKLAEPPPQN